MPMVWYGFWYSIGAVLVGYMIYDIFIQEFLQKYFQKSSKNQHFEKIMHEIEMEREFIKNGQ